MSMQQSIFNKALVGIAFAGLMAGSMLNVHAADNAAIAAKAAPTVVTRAPHKAINPFHRRHVINETAEFARLETMTERELRSSRQP